MTMAPRRITFPGSSGAALAARFDLPATPPKAYALFAHCFTCSKDVVAASGIAAALTAHGIGVLRFDFTGLGASDGEFANTDFSSNLGDLIAAADWLRQEHRAPQLLVGHSLGGAAVIAAAASIPEVRAVATISAPADAAHVTKLFAGDIEAIEATGRATVSIAGRPFTIRREFLHDIEQHSIEERAGALRRALLIVHSPVDSIVGIENAARLFTAAKHPKSFVSLDGADHLLTARDHAAYAASMIATWADRYLVDEHPALPVPSRSAPVIVAETGLGTFLNHVVVGNHRLLADEPVDIGGFDAGPSPYDFLAAGLGACTSMTLRLYAERKGMPVRQIAVEVSHDKIHAEDLDECVEGDGTRIDQFRRVITLDGDLDDDARASLARIAERCPVHRTLEQRAQIVTTLAP